MRIVVPITVTEGNLVSNNITEDASNWSSVTSYVIGDTVRLASGSSVNRYFTAIADNTNKNPVDYAGYEAPSIWREIYGTSAWRLFDKRTGAPDYKTGGNIVVSVKPFLSSPSNQETVTTICLINLQAASVKVKITDPVEGVVYEETKSALALDHIYDPYEWFFEPPAFKTNVLFDYLPPYQEATYEITIYNGEGSLASCGEIILGQAYYLGCTGYGSSTGIADYSKSIFFENDDTGGAPFGSSATYLKKGPSSQTNDFMVIANAKTAAHIRRTLQGIISEPILFIGNGSEPRDQVFDDETDEWGIVFGFYRDFSMTLESEPHSIWNLSIEERI